MSLAAKKWEAAFETFRQGVLQKGGISEMEAVMLSAYGWESLPQRAKKIWQAYFCQ